MTVDCDGIVESFERGIFRNTERHPKWDISQSSRQHHAVKCSVKLHHARARPGPKYSTNS